MFNVYYHIIEFCDFMLVCLFASWVLSLCVCVYVFWIHVLYQVWYENIFSLQLFFFILLTVFFKENNFNFDNVKLSWIMFLVSYLRRLCLPEGHKIFSLYFISDALQF